jgi:hypothetical protein
LERKISPLHLLNSKAHLYLKEVPFDNSEKHGRTGHFKGNRRDFRKKWHNLKFLMDYIQQKVVERNAFEQEITPSLVDRMLKAVAETFLLRERDSQMRWLMM